MKFKNLKLSTKQKIGFSIVLTLMAGVNIFSLYNMDKIKHEIDEVTTNWLPRAIALSEINLNSSELRRIQLQQAFTKDETSKQEQAMMTIVLLDKISKNVDTYDSLKTASEMRNLYSEKEGKLYAEFDQKWEHYQDLCITFFKHVRNEENEQALDLLNGEAREVFNDFSADLVELVNVNKKDSFDAAKRAEDTFRSTFVISIILLIGTFLVSAIIATRLVKFITEPVERLEEAAGKVAEGDLDIHLDIPSKDEIGNLSVSFNQMTNSLRKARAKMESQATQLRAQNKELEHAMRELKDTQEQLLLKEKMASLGDLVAGVAHEINNPIGAVNASTDVSGRCLEKIELVLEKSKSIEEIKRNDQLSQALKLLKNNIRVTLTAGNRIATIVKSLRNFARLDEAEYQKANIHQGLDSSLTLMTNELQGRVTVNKDYGDIPEIICYPGQLNQVFLNLLKNASNAIEGSGTIEIKTFRENSLIHIEISDTGTGIPHEKLDKLFDFGFSGGGARVKLTSGLSTAYNIIQKHDGQIKVDSKMGKGTKFSIILPVK